MLAAGMGVAVNAHSHVDGDLSRIASLLDEAASIVRNQLAVPASARPGCAVTPEAPPLLSLRQVAKRLGVHVRTARRWRDEKYLPAAIVLGGVVRYDAAEIEKWIEARKERPR